MNSPIPASNVYPYRQSNLSRATREQKQVLLDPHGGPDFHELLESVWKNSSDAMRITDSEGVIIAVNDAYTRFVGMQRGELVGKVFTIVYDRMLDPVRIVEEYCRRFSERSVEPLMSRQVRLRNGTEPYVETSNSFIEGSDRETYVLSIFHDITERRASEEALRASELKFRSVAQSAVSAIISANSRSIVTSWNDAAGRFFGYEEHEILGKSILIIIPERFRATHQRWVERLRMSGEPQVIGKTVELLGLRKDGNEFPIELSLSTWSTLEGPCFAAIIRDITERKTLEAELSSAAEMAKLGYWEYDVDSRNFTFSDQYFRLIHRSSTEKQGGNVMSAEEFARRLVYPEDAPLVGKALHEAISSPDPNFSGKQEARVFRENGDVANVTVEFKVLKDRSGRTYKVVGANQDITERKQMEQALERKRVLLSTVIDNLPDRIFAKDTESRFIINNQAHIQALGAASQTEVIGKSDFDFRPRSLADTMFKDDQDVIRSGKPIVEKEEQTVDASGRTNCLLVTKVPMRDKQGTVIGLVGISRDVTERKALEVREQEHLAALKTSQESLAELNAQKDRLFSILSHDLRSPFTSILGFCEILLNENEVVTEAERKEFVGHIQNSAERQLVLLNKLLDWSRLETGRIKFDVRDVDLSAVVALSVTSHLGIAKKKEITLQSTLPKQMKTRGDEVMIMQAFSNLISNALKFTPAHGLISIDLVESKEDRWILAVRDTGAGIPKDDFCKLFKIEEKYTRKGLGGEEGTGLGLSVVHEIIKKHSGSITVESEVGKGTTFFVQFPKLMEVSDRTVLVVDDDEGVRVLHSRFLKRMFPDSRIIQAGDGKEAFELAKRYRPRIILTDYSMPEMNGFEFLNLLRQEATTKDIPVFVITGKDSTASTEAMRLSGAAAVLTKPVSSTKLQEAIGKVMEERV